MRTQVAIVGAGPAGLLLAHLLHQRGIDTVVLERQTRTHVEQRIRAGVLEHGTVELLRAAGLADRLDREGLVHHGLELLFDQESHRVDLSGLCGRTITVYGQHELVKDLIAARLATGAPLLFEAGATSVSGVDTTAPVVEFTHQGQRQQLRADWVAGCDGFHGVSRAASRAATHTRDYPYAWLGVLAEAPPSSHELIYAYHPDGFALHSMRSPQLTRLYLQVPPGTDPAAWPDERIWEQLRRRLARADPHWQLATGPIVDKGVTGLRSVVTEPMRAGRLVLAGDAAHIVPATGAKGLNLAVADVAVLATALGQWYATGREDLLDAYSATCLARVWQVQYFSWWMTSLLHRAPAEDPFATRMQRAQLRGLARSTAGATWLAENYTGLPLTV